MRGFGKDLFLGKRSPLWEFVREINASFSRPFGLGRCAKQCSWGHFGAASATLGSPEAQEGSANSRSSHEDLPPPKALLGSLSEETSLKDVVSGRGSSSFGLLSVSFGPSLVPFWRVASDRILHTPPARRIVCAALISSHQGEAHDISASNGCRVCCGKLRLPVCFGCSVFRLWH